MSKVADVKLSWSKSPSADVSKVKAIISKDGTETVSEFGPEVESFQIVVEAQKSVSFRITVEDSEGLTSTSESYSFTLGDLEAPQPPTSLTHSIVAVRDVP